MADAKQNYELLPPPDKSDAVGKKVFAILDEIIKDKANLGLHDKWLRHYRLSRNQPWTSKAPAGVPLASANLLHTHRQRTVNTLTDNSPNFNVKRIGTEADDEIYRTIERASEYWWQEQEQQAVFEKSVLNGETYGVCIEKVVFDPDLEFGLGEVRTDVVDPFYFGVYPVRCADVQQAEAVAHFEPMSLREARRRWPEHAARIQADYDLLNELGDDRRDNINPAPSGPKGFLSSLLGDGFGGAYNVKKDEVMVCELWVKDYTMEKVTESVELVTTDDSGRPVQSFVEVENEQPKYPGYIRCVTVCGGGKVVLSDRGNPSINPALTMEEAAKTYLYDKFPFVMVPSITDTSTPWGMSDFEQLEVLQREVNKSLSQLIYHKDKAARPKIINPKNSGIPNSHFNNRLGILNPNSAEAAQFIKYIDFPNNTQDIQGVFELVKGLFFTVSGAFDMDDAKQADGDSRLSYRSLSTILERAATMMRGKIRNYYRLIRERGRMFVSHMQNWYAEERWISFQENGQEYSAPVTGQMLRIPARLTVVNGSTLPVSKVAQREEAIALYEKGAVDRRELLERLEWPNRVQINERMDLGPNGVLLDRAKKAGFPESGITWLQEVSSLDDKSFAIKLHNKEIPPVPVQGSEEDPAMQMAAAQRKKTEMEVHKMASEVSLIDVQARKIQAETARAMAEIEDAPREAMRKDAEVMRKEKELETKRVTTMAQVKQAQAGIENARKKEKPDGAA